MDKTDKELTAEIVVAFLTACNGPNGVPVKSNQLPEIIKITYNTLRGLSTQND